MKFELFIRELYNKLNNPELCIEFAYENIGLIITSFKRFLSNDKTTHLPLIDKYDMDEAKNLFNKSLNNTNDKLSDTLSVPLYFHILLHLLARYNSMELKEEDEVKIAKSKITYQVIVADTKIKEKLFTLFIPMFALEAHLRDIEGSKRTQQTFVGIDYEFKQRKIALMQINFERIPSKTKETFSFIWLVNPDTFDNISKDILIRYLMRNKKIFKILHGSDSLDTPYMYDELFMGDYDTIRDFASRHIDTRFLCEYYKITNNEEKKCAIYDALLFFNTINEKKYKFLNETHDEMGPVQYISWEIDKLSSFHLKYALYDVLYLKHFLFDIYIMSKKNSPEYFEGYHMIPRLVQFIMLERKEVTKLFPVIKTFADKMNNFFYIDQKNQKRKLIDVYTWIEESLFITDYHIKINHLTQITYIRKYIINLIKFIAYNLIAKNYTIYEKNDTIFNNDIDLEWFFTELDKNNYSHLIPFFRKVASEISKYVL